MWLPTLVAVGQIHIGHVLRSTPLFYLIFRLLILPRVCVYS